MHKTIHGDCVEVMATMPADYIDAIVSDPPYDLKFMGKGWDGTGVAFRVETWREALRVLKPGGHLLAFGGTRTYHRMVCAIEDAGFQIRDSIHWIHGSGFPKSANVGKQIRKMYSEKRRAYGLIPTDGTETMQRYMDRGTALKPAHEPIVLARKPLSESSVAANVLEHGCGALNISATRVGTEQTTTTIKDLTQAHGNRFGKAGITYPKIGERTNPPGRWPANVLLSHSEDCKRVGEKRVKPIGSTPKTDSRAELYGIKGRTGTPNYTDPEGMETVADYRCEDGCQVRLMDEQSGVSKSPNPYERKVWREKAPFDGGMHVDGNAAANYGDSGGASRFFKTFEPDAGASFIYAGKASPKERDAGLGHKDNDHPTVKSLALCDYLIQLITPPGGRVLDPFMGSGSTGCSAVRLGYEYIGIEKELEYIEIAAKRIAYWRGANTPARATPARAHKPSTAPTLFD